MLVHTPKELADYIKEYRKSNKQSQAKLGDLVGLKQTTVSAFENQPKSTKLDTLFRILAASGIELHAHPRGSEASKGGWTEEW